MNKPSIADILRQSGHTTFTEDLVKRAMYSLYGNIGAGIDLRDWGAIMAAPDPLAASEIALVLMYQDPVYLRQNIDSLVAGGAYGPAQVEWTYREMYVRLGLSYRPGWADGTTHEPLGTMPLDRLLNQAQGEAAARVPPATPTAELSGSNAGISLNLNVAASASLSVSGALGSFTAGLNVLADQAAIKSGTLTATNAANVSSAATSGFLTLGTAGDDNIDTSSAGTRVDYINGGAGNDTLDGGAGNDVISGGAGNDVIAGGIGTDADTLYGGDGDDRFVYVEGSYLFGGTLIDSIDGGAGTNAIALDSQNNSIQIFASSSWASRISNVSKIIAARDTGGQINIALHDNAYEAGLRIVDLSADTFTAINANFIDVSAETGSANGYVLIGHAGVDFITGGAGNDTITGGASNDSLAGGNGDDVFILTSAADHPWSGPYETMSGGAGTDVLRYTEVNNTLRLSPGLDVEEVRMVTADGSALTGGTVGDINATQVPSSVHIRLYGNDAYNVLQGNGGNNRIETNGGADMVYGYAGDDTIVGGSGNDTMLGGAGNDSLTGGSASDTFKFEADASTNGVDTFTDFTPGAGGDAWNFANFISGGSFGNILDVTDGTDMALANKVFVLSGTETDIDETAEIANLINGAGTPLSLANGAKGVVISGSATITVDGSNDRARIFFVHDANSNGTVDAGEVVLVGITQADFVVGNLVGTNFSFT